MEKIKPSEAFIEEEIMGYSIHPRKLADAFDTLAEKVESLEARYRKAWHENNDEACKADKPEAEEKKRIVGVDLKFAVCSECKKGICFCKYRLANAEWNYAQEKLDKSKAQAQAAKEHFARMIDDVLNEWGGVPVTYEALGSILKKRLENL